MNQGFTTDWLSGCIAEGARNFFSTRAIVTPELAEELLARNPSNRSITQSRVDLYAEDIRAGRWTFNGEPIIVSRDGRVTDGQHRCAAIIKAGLPIETAIAFGVDYETRKTTNQLRPKTAGDFASMAGIPNAMGQAAIANMAIAYERNRMLRNAKITHAEVLAYIEANQSDLARSAAICHSRSSKMKNIVSPAVLGFVHYVTAKRNVAMADQYAEQIITGEGLHEGDPAMAVRNRFISMGKGTRAEKAEMLLHGWNAYRRGKKRVIAKVTGTLPEVV